MGKEKIADIRFREGQKRRQQFLDQLTVDPTRPIMLVLQDCGFSMSQYDGWRKVYPHFRVEVDRIRNEFVPVKMRPWDGTRQHFAAKYFGMTYTHFQAMFLDEIDTMPPGNIVMALWPPEHGKTTTYENFATQELATNPNWRGTVASENILIARKIVGRIRNRLEPAGPLRDLVRDFGPFRPDVGIGRSAIASQPWSSQYFNVFRKQDHDERDYSMLALGFGSSIVSTRTDHLHIDDIQSLKTLDRTDKIEDWFRQDALSRPGEHGKTSVVGTRVGEDDFYERIADDPDLTGILKVIRFKAIMTDYTDPANPVERPLWPERYTLDMLDRQRRKVGQEAWDRNYMQNPGASRRDATFLDEHFDLCYDTNISLRHRPTDGAPIYVSLDPALGGMNCIMAFEIAGGKMVLRMIREHSGLRSNEQIMQEVNSVVYEMNRTGRVTDLVIEAMNFQRGLARDERLREMQQHYGFAVREHLTGFNKYDENVGVPSMVTSFIKGDIVLPWAADDYTRNEVGELIRQLKAWKPKARGNKLRQDRVMALWFAWILWQSRWKATPDGGHGEGWKRHVPWGRAKSGYQTTTGAAL